MFATVISFLHGAMRRDVPKCAGIALCAIIGLAMAPLARADFANNYGVSTLTRQVNGIASSVVDAQGNVYITGSFAGTTLPLGSVTLSKVGIVDTYLAKLDASGRTIWARSVGRSGATAETYRVIADKSGNVYLGGFFNYARQGSVNRENAYVGKFDSAGSVLWQRDFDVGIQAITGTLGMEVDSQGNVYLGGNLTGTNLAVPALTAYGPADGLVLKLDGTRGSIVWARNFGGSGATTKYSAIGVDRQDNVYFLGAFVNQNLASPALARIGLTDGFVVKLDAGNGAMLWARGFGGKNASMELDTVVLDDAGSAYITGAFSTANLTSPPLTRLGNTDGLVMKLEANGGTAWAMNYGGGGASTSGGALSLDSSGNLYLAGAFHAASLSTPSLTRIGTGDAMAMKLNAGTGATIWAKNFGGPGADAGFTSIASDGAGGIYVGGYLQVGSLTTPAVTKIGAFDLLTMRLDVTGNVPWAKSWGGAGATMVASAIAFDGAGGLYAWGRFGAASLTTPALTRISSADAFIFKQDGGPVPNATLVEYYHAAFDHYFITSAFDEIAKLDDGAFVGWTRTGLSFAAYVLGRAGTADTCRFFSTSFAPKSSHFYTPIADECELVKTSADWQFEGTVFGVVLPDGGGGCPQGTIALYRLYNNGQGDAPNHRYTVSLAVRQTMLGKGWIPEGNGTLGVIACVPP